MVAVLALAYGSNSTSFANTETVGSDCDLDSGDVAEAESEAESEAGPSTNIVSYYDSCICNMCIYLCGIIKNNWTKARE